MSYLRGWRPQGVSRGICVFSHLHELMLLLRVDSLSPPDQYCAHQCNVSQLIAHQYSHSLLSPIPHFLNNYRAHFGF